ncbi:flagellar assembly protein FliH [Xylophilus rhododendri]|uniref:Flagellar assembly protein FliH n=1 Tax=Xylophilus rhododendri TaxID=2697032 RepID=A0A857J1Z6_9BURK|nr:FliH/SctL family protein [Xylophilus rhododendri]QHI97944.1 flagellar assembly protein FliH [Xylophilus rhododendri]
MSDSGSHRYTRFIPDEEIDRAAPWLFAAVDERARLAEEEALRVREAQAAERQPVYLKRIQDAYEAGRQQGYEDGHAEALAEAEKKLEAYIASDAQASAERLAGLTGSMGDSLGQAQDRIAVQVLEMAVAMARQVLRRELAADPHALLPVVREAMGQLIADGRPATVRMHPADLERLRVPLQEEFTGVAVAWVADAAMPASSCQVESSGTVIDGRLQTRWQRAISALGVDMPLEGGDEAPEASAGAADEEAA